MVAKGDQVYINGKAIKETYLENKAKAGMKACGIV
ncbi:hypothetical protein HPL003_23855 [Paenibacillus terrae HPL-003]|uniref:Uncharacterized protein n=1 Tax=Paenibacillus terrae (strain HPL-003) TaxID=985665 RepID=G7VSJ9_PAETH|nr:hypothetical protein HPL003_23855 [Paenibacillus terrae HPL-003]